MRDLEYEKEALLVPGTTTLSNGDRAPILSDHAKNFSGSSAGKPAGHFEVELTGLDQVTAKSFKFPKDLYGDIPSYYTESMKKDLRKQQERDAFIEMLKAVVPTPYHGEVMDTWEAKFAYPGTEEFVDTAARAKVTLSLSDPAAKSTEVQIPSGFATFNALEYFSRQKGGRAGLRSRMQGFWAGGQARDERGQFTTTAPVYTFAAATPKMVDRRTRVYHPLTWLQTCTAETWKSLSECEKTSKVNTIKSEIFDACPQLSIDHYVPWAFRPAAWLPGGPVSPNAKSVLENISKIPDLKRRVGVLRAEDAAARAKSRMASEDNISSRIAKLWQGSY